ncbi:glycoside hydrolase family 172 protein [Echinicola sediminis]
MKNSKPLYFLFIYLGLLLLPLGSKAQVTFASLLKEMTDRKSLSEWPEPFYLTKQASSYSRESVNKQNLEADAGYFTGNYGDQGAPRDWGQGWFENHDFSQYIRTEVNQERKEDVMFEDNGPGAIVRFWAVYGGIPDELGGIYRVYIDGNPFPVIEMYHKNMVGGKGLIGKPFSFFAPEKAENDTWRGRNLILPIPYGKSCKITYDGEHKYDHIEGWKGHYYQINYRSYSAGTKVESFGENTLKAYQTEIAKAAEKLAEKPEIRHPKIKEGNISLGPGQSFVKKIKGSQAIDFFQTRIAAADQEQALRSTVVSISFDGKETVWCPIGQFYGIGYLLRPHQTYYSKVDASGLMSSSWVMPFEKEATVKITNYGDQEVVLEEFAMDHKTYAWSDQSMYFHGTWKETRGLNTQLRSDYNYVTVKGRGVFVGDNLTLFNSFPDTSGINWWGEGDEKIYVDHEPFPSHFGTGTEDYYCYAYCRPQPFSSPIASQPVGEGNKTPGVTSNNRHRLLDAIPFKEAFTFDMEIWHPHRAAMNYSPATFYYAFRNAEDNIDQDVHGVSQKVALDLEEVAEK